MKLLRYPLELMFTYYNDKFENYAVAEKGKDGILVLSHVAVVNPFASFSRKNSMHFGFLSQPGENSALGFEKIKDDIKKVREYNSNYTIHREKELSLAEFWPEVQNEFFMYNGSIPVPPCGESTTYLVNTRPVHVPTELVSEAMPPS